MNISFVSAMYNSEKWIEKMIESIPLEYAYEIIVCDDGSTDNSLELLRKYENQIPQLKIITNDINKGNSYTCNKLLSQVTGDYITMIDTDDYYLPKIKEVCKLVDGTYDMYWFDLLATNGHIFKARNKGILWSGNLKIYKRTILGDAVYGPEGRGDVSFTQELFKNSNSNLYTEIIAYHYNYPRIGSVNDRSLKGEFDFVKKEGMI